MIFSRSLPTAGDELVAGESDRIMADADTHTHAREHTPTHLHGNTASITSGVVRPTSNHLI